MNTQHETLTTYQAALEVWPRGYWFSGGGEKGSFGYYPHLRDYQGLPVYPDTQILGNLKMAARWLVELGAAEIELVDFLFGTGGGDEMNRVSKSSRVFPGDLVLDESYREQWHADRFEVKTRIQINDATRTVEEHCLVDLEMARLDDLKLQAPIFLVVPESKLKDAVKLLEDVVRLLSGFGAFRSRGYGRGKVAVTEFVPCGEVMSEPFGLEDDTPYRYSLTALVNVRNKPVDPGNAQVITSDSVISPDQLKGWLARACYESDGSWPAPGLMAAVQFSHLYPSPRQNLLVWPPPMSTIVDADGKVTDTWGKERQDSGREENDLENFFAGKVKPLTGHTVTEDGGIHPVVVKSRVRNAMDDAFSTIQNGLFVQEFLPAGTIFTGTIRFSPGISSEFKSRIITLMTGSIPGLKGALFAPHVGDKCPHYGAANGKPELLAGPRPFQELMRQEGNAINIATLRGYNTVCKRPRRGRVMAMPGSTFTKSAKSGEKPWLGFTEGHQVLAEKQNRAVAGPEDSGATANRQVTAKDYLVKLSADQKSKISKSQAGILRSMLHPALTKNFLDEIMGHRIDKYGQKGREPELLELLKKLQEILNADGDGGLEKMRTALQGVLEQLALARWGKKDKKAGADTAIAKEAGNENY